MILIDKPTLRFLLRGRPITTTTARLYRRGHDYEVGSVAGHTVCRALIVSVTQTSDGWRLELVQYRGDAPRYLARNPAAQRTDYVSEPSRAAWDEHGPLEAPKDDSDRRWLAYQAAQAAERDDLERRRRAHAARLERRGRRFA